MQPMGNENPGPRGRRGAPPFGSVPQTVRPFMSSERVVGSGAFDYRAPSPVTFDGTSMPSRNRVYLPANGGPYQRNPAPQLPFPRSLGPPVGQPIVPPPVLSSAVPQVTPPLSYRPQSQNPVPMRPVLQNVNRPVPRFNAPLLESPAFAPNPPLHGFPTHQAGSVSHAQTPHFPAHHGGYAPTWPPPPTASAPLNLRDQIQHPGGGPPVGSLQGLVEEFQSLSISSVPGSLDPGIYPATLPRPLDGDEEPKCFAEMYPLNCHSRYLRLTTNAIPSSQSLLSRWHLPLGAVVHPLAEAPDGEEIPVVNFGSAGIIRCRRCRTYVNPYVMFTDGGRKWRCNICALINDVPGEYFADLDANGRRIDADQRPELTKGSVELVAPTEYMVRPPMPPVYFFLIDVSSSAARSGMLEVVSKTIKSCLDELSGLPRTQIGFLTFDSTLHFYNMKATLLTIRFFLCQSSLTQPQMMVVSDIDEIFLPLPDDLLVNLSESRSVIDVFLDSLPSMFLDNGNVESAFGPALKAAFMVMSQLGGKLLIFQSTLPSLGVGRLKLRKSDPHVSGTDKEHALRVPEDLFYKQMAADLTKFQIGVNVYAFSDKYTDIASLGTLAKYTGGQVYYYPNFHVALHHQKLRYELSRDLTRETAWEAVMRIRCGKGVRFTTYHGHFMLRSTDLMALPAVDCDKAFAMQLSLEDTLLTTQTVFFQVALFCQGASLASIRHTSSSGERRIRVHTAAVPVVTDLGEMYRQADTGAIVSLLSRLAIEKTLSSKLEDVRHSVQLRIVKSLKEYRSLYAVQHRIGARIIYPESLRFLILYGLALCKSIPLRVDAQLDERCAAGYTMMTLSVRRMLKLLYPKLIRVDEYLIMVRSYLLRVIVFIIIFFSIIFPSHCFISCWQTPAKADDLGKCKGLPLVKESFDSRGLYIFDDGLRFIIWFGNMLPSHITSNILGGGAFDFIDLSKASLCEYDNEVSKKLRSIVNKLRNSEPSCYQMCHFVRQDEQSRKSSLLLANLVEDHTAGGSCYVDWTLQIHRQVQQSA
ncbi:hypothetical protein GIB67_038492 [Kingdonia uniflora]|uniref:Uncharacterized protein n=1 Tax=Kingdonia uniflora TaxID=39325 RepID=A0A7J7NP81_9MAGN|nr:hypothetical protein GIB67_038492 [Kingdonia uniflora]